MRLSSPVTKPAPNVSFGMAGGGVPLETPVGYGLAGFSGRPAETRSGDAAEKHSGRSRRWHHPWQGHRWRHRLSSCLGDGRPALPLVSANTTSDQSRLGVVLSFPRWPARTVEEGT